MTFPHEHGGSLTALGATAAAAGVAPSPWPALAVGLAVTAAFFARGPVDRLAARTALRAWDGAALVVLAACALAGVVLAGARGAGWAGATLALCVSMLIASALARRSRAHRAPLFEALGMGGLAASAGLGALAAGTAPALAAAAAVVVAAHTMSAVPIVRAELRRRERAGEPRALAFSALGLAGAAVILALLAPPALLALAPRAAHLAWRATTRPRPGSPARVGLRETLLLAATVLLLVLLF